MPSAIKLSRRVSFVCLFVVVACGESSTDVYLKAIQQNGEANKGPCSLGYNQTTRANVINSDRLYACIQEKKRVQAEYARAKSLGHEGRDIELAQQVIQEEIEKYESMLRMVGRMEHQKEMDEVKRDEAKVVSSDSSSKPGNPSKPNATSQTKKPENPDIKSTEKDSKHSNE